MEFTPALSAFQGALISADNVHSFSRLKSKGGNEEKVDFIISSLRRFLETEKYIDENGLLDNMISNTRKFFMYIILNVDLPVIQDMMDMTELEPVIWSVPTVSKYLMCEMVWHLHMENFLYELIPSSWPQLGIEVAEAVLENFKYFNPTECLNKLLKLCAACYKLICKLTSFTTQDEDMLKNLFDILKKYLKYYTNPPNEYKLDALTTDGLYKYKGDRFKSMMFLVLECCKFFTQPVNFTDDNPLYKLTYNQEYVTISTCNVCDSSNKAVLECLNNSNTFLLDIFMEIVMDISIDIFCAWSEYTEGDKSVQQIIGELCDKVLETLQNINSMSEHQVLPMLQLMARKPTTIKDIINTVDTTSILEKINSNNEDSESWIHALVNKEDLCENNQLLDIVDTRLEVFSDKECLELYNKIKHSICDDSIREEFLISLTIKLFDKCNVVDKHLILKEQFKDKIFVDTIGPSQQDFNGKLTEMFNKFIADSDDDNSEVLTVFYQNPGQVYAKIFGLAAQNAQLSDPMLNVMKLLKDYTEHYYNDQTEACVIRNMRSNLNGSLDMKQSTNIIKFICELKNNSVISASHILLFVIMPGIHDALVLKHITKLHVHVKLLTAAFPIEELSSYKAPMVITIAQVLMVARKVELGLKEFKLEALEAVETVLKFLKTLLSTYSDQFTAQESSWIRRKLVSMNLSPINFYYFRSFWNNTHMNLFESVTEQPVERDTSLDVLASKLRQILPWAILDEWCEIWDSFLTESIRRIDALRVFNTAMHSLTVVINTHRTENTLASLFYSYRNFIHMIRYKYFEEPLRDNRVKFCMSLLADNLESTKSEDYHEIESIVMPLFSYLAEKEIDFRANVIIYFINNRFIHVVNRFLPTNNIG